MAAAPFTLAAGVPPTDGQHPQPEAGIASISSTGRAPRGQQEKSPVSVACCRALGTNQTDHEPPLTEASSAASVGQSCHMAAPVFPATKAEATAAARLALLGWALNRAELASAYVATRWDSKPVILADLAAVAAFTGLMEAQS